MKSNKTKLHHLKPIFVAVLTLLPGLSGPCLLAQTPHSALVTLVSSDFEVDADGWRGTNDVGGQQALARHAGGATPNSLGYISVSENQGDGDTMFFAAPAKYLGDKRAAYNGRLRFQFKQSATTSLSGLNRLVLLGSGNLILSFDLASFPGTNWQTFEIPLNENAGWHVVPYGSLGTSNQRATRDDFLAVLPALDRLWIKAEWSTHNFDQSDLDDVALLGWPSGPTPPVVSSATYAGVMIAGAVGASYRIEYRDSLTSSSGWQKLADVVLPSSPHLFIDESSPGASQRFYRTVLNP